MENFMISFNAVMPLTLMIGLGYCIKFLFHLSMEELRKLNSICFKVFLPLLLFRNIYGIDVAEGAFNIRLALFAAGLILVVFLGLCLLVPLIESERRKTGVLIQGIFRSNFILFGLPIALSLYGEKGGGVVSLMIAVVIPLFNILAVVVLEMFCGEKTQWKQIFFSICKNPLILAVLAGMAAKEIGLILPIALERAVYDVSMVATPLSLIVLGASFTFKSASHYRKQLYIGVLGKLLFMPVIGVIPGILLGFKGADLLVLILMLASPGAVSSFTMAQQMDADSELAGQLVVWSSAFSCLTVFMWIFATRQLGLL